MDAVAEWMKASPINAFVMGNGWVWPTLEIFHFLGLCLLLGSLLLVDLRVVGFSKVPLKPVHAFVPVAIIGFTLNLVTGLLFLIGNPDRYFPNPAFQIKMLAVVLAGLNVLYFETKIHPAIRAQGDQATLGLDAKIVGAASLVFWITVIIGGRMIPYVGPQH